MSGASGGHNRGILRRLLDARAIQTLAIYIPVAWVFTEIITAATANFGLPTWLPGLAMVVLISGIPVVAFLVWAFQITEQGIRTEVVSVKGGLVIAVASAALLGTGIVLFQRLAPPESIVETAPPATAESVTSVPVLEFEVPEGFELTGMDLLTSPFNS